MENTHEVTNSSYELLDSGLGRKLERFGRVILDRPDPQVIWNFTDEELWKKTTAQFDTSWHGRKNIPEHWSVQISGLTFELKLSTFKHVGVFPEQESNWDWIQEKITKANRPIKVLNLFAYTGGATLASARAGAEVCHVDGSKTAIEWAKRNAELSLLGNAPIRWMLDDVMAFVRREIRRGNTYDAIIMDPPVTGHGPKGEVWKIEKDLTVLLENCKKLLSDHPLFVIVNGYASTYSATSYAQALQDIMKDKKGTVTSKELLIPQKNGNKVLPAGICARFEA